MNKKTSNINNFIGVYDNYITKQECDKAIKLFEDQKKFKNTITRLNSESSPTLIKQDQQYFASYDLLDVWWKDLQTIIVNYDITFRHYLQNTGANIAYGENQKFGYTSMKIQKTSPSEGYHIWHVEHAKGFENSKRAFVFSIYLNDVKEGGETEFLHQSVRIKPKKGRIVIWPAGFPYVHRGNPPISGKKYILTSWMILQE